MSCSVYDASLLGSGPADGGNGGSNPNAGSPGSAGEGNAGPGRGGSSGGSAGESSGDAGMMDTAGAMDNGGDTGDGGRAGSGGTAGKSSSGGTAGVAGKMGAGGSAGSGGTIVAGGNSGTGGSAAGTGGAIAGAGGSPGANGCAKLSVPLNESNDRAHFVISLPSAIDLSNATTAIISMRLYVQAGAAGAIFNYVQDSQFHFLGLPPGSRPLLKSLTGWQTITLNVGSQPAGSTTKTDIRRIGIEINAMPDNSGWSNPTVVYVDSITVMSPATSYTFDMSSTVSTNPSSTDVSGQVLWLHNGSSDTTATGASLGWQATCP